MSRTRVVLPVLIVLAAAGCGHRVQRLLAPESPPVVRLDVPQVLSSTDEARVYAIRWSGSDADGRVRGYAWALDPATNTPDATWHHTDSLACEIRLDLPATGRAPSHRFVVRAIDDHGNYSEPAGLAIRADNLPPLVTITCPVPTASTFTSGRGLRIDWDGIDPDGLFTQKPISYKYVLLGPASYPISPDLAWQQPDSLWNYYANHPDGAWTGWDRTSGDTTNVTFSNLTPGVTYVFAVIAFDEWGDPTAALSHTANMLRFGVTTDSALTAPALTMTGPGIRHTFPAGTFSTQAAAIADDPLKHVAFEVAPGTPLTIDWSAQAQPASCGTRFRWALDPTSIGDDAQWSAWSGVVTGATVGPFTPPLPPKRAVHSLYVQTEDLFGRNMGVFDLVVVPQQFSKELLVVDDTRFEPDQFIGGAPRAYGFAWPSAAELDTFLFARGGVPWQYYPAGTLSTPGLFRAYDFDTLGTRALLTGSVPLSTLSQYRHVVWITDYNSATFNGTLTSPINPMTAMRSMSNPGHVNPLPTYVAMGGRLWLMGGGVAYANLISLNTTSNDASGITLFDSARGELTAGTMTYDVARWRSAVVARKGLSAPGGLHRYLGRYSGTSAYPGLPDTLIKRSAATDPLPPRRTNAAYYLTTVSFEGIRNPNDVLEGGVSQLDTLMASTTLVAGQNTPVMTLAPAGDPRVVCSGISCWDWTRSSGQQLVDFVMQDLWGVAPAPAAVASRAPARR